jgi:hypothetical protein
MTMVYWVTVTTVIYEYVSLCRDVLGDFGDPWCGCVPFFEILTAHPFLSFSPLFTASYSRGHM